MLTMIWLTTARADPPDLPDRLSDRPDACRGDRCVSWWEGRSMGGCIGSCCNQHTLLLTDRTGRILGELEDRPHRPRAESEEWSAHPTGYRFLSDDRFAEEWLGWAVPHPPGSEPLDIGFAAIETVQVVRQLEREPSRPEDGIFTRVTEVGWVHPDRAAPLVARIGEIAVPSGVVPPVTDPKGLPAVRQACESPPAAPVLFHECGARGCVWVLGGAPGESSADPEAPQKAWCLVLGDGEHQWVRRYEAYGGWWFGVNASRLCFQYPTGGPYGSEGSTECFSRQSPGRMGFVDPAGIHVDSGEWYPLLVASTAADGWTRALTVHADTIGRVSWGSADWDGPADAALAWQAVRVDTALVLRATVDDDDFGPSDTALASDHLELDLTGPGPPGGVQPATMRLAALPRGDGTLALRIWRRGTQEVDAPFPGTGTWVRTARGWTAELHLSLADVLVPLEATLAVQAGVFASDGDGGRQQSRVGTVGTMRLWDAYPPTIDASDRMAVEVGRFLPVDR